MDPESWLTNQPDSFSKRPCLKTGRQRVIEKAPSWVVVAHTLDPSTRKAETG